MPLEPTGELALSFAEPAGVWEEALPLGNGRLGAMVHGTHPVERIGLNEDTFWSGPGDTAVPEIPDGLLERVRRSVAEGRHVEAGRELRVTQGADAEAYQPIGELELTHLDTGRALMEYRRTLNLRDGVALVERAGDGHTYRQEVFASVEHQVIAVRLETDSPEGLQVGLRLTTPQARARLQPGPFDGSLELLLAAPRHVVPWPRTDGVVLDDDDQNSIRAAALLLVQAEGPEAHVAPDPGGASLTVRNASAATLYIAIRTGFRAWNEAPTLTEQECSAAAAGDVHAATTAGWPKLRATHVTAHRELMDRVTLRLDDVDRAPDLPTDVRLVRRAAGQADEHLCVLAFNLGRYLLAASSRPGTQAANLQGIWNDRVSPPWNSQYTVNINVEMNYWPAESAGLPECHAPLLRLIADLADAGRPAARGIYGARGWTCHHNTDLWRIAVPVGLGHGNPMWAQWPLGGAWLCSHLAEHWRFGRDTRFLADTAFPICLDAARFVLDLLVETPDGKLVTSPSTSPENDFVTPHGNASVDAGSAMDLTLARELFEFVLEAADALEPADRDSLRDAETEQALEEIRGALTRLAPLRIGSRGQILEWSAEREEADPHHRHVSHLVGIFPGHSAVREPHLREAARRSLEERGDEGTGWSIAWKIGLWARLGEGAAAHRLLGHYLRPLIPTDSVGGGFTGGVYRSMLCAHPPFQIDGNFGVTAAVAELLLQSHETLDGAPVLDLLPALPPRWPSGRVTGLRAPGAVTLRELTWSAGAMRSAIVEARADTTVNVRYRDTSGQRHTHRLALQAGEHVEFDGLQHR